MKKQDLKNTYITTKYMLSSVLKKRGGKPYFFLKLLITVIEALIPLVYILFPGLIIDELIGDQRLPYLLSYIAILCILPIANGFIRTYLYKKVTDLRYELTRAFSIDFYSHVADMDFELNESPEIQTLKGRAQQTLESSVAIVESVLNFIRALLSLIAIAAVILTINPIIILLIVIQVTINAALAKRLEKKTHQVDVETSALGRKIYANTCVFEDDDYAKELRLFHLKDFAIGLYAKNKAEEDAVWIRNTKDHLLTDAKTMLVNNVQQLLVYLYLVMRVLQNALPIGRLTICLSSVNQFSGNLSGLFSAYIDLIGKSFKIDELIEFLNIPSKQQNSGHREPVFDENSVIEFKNVSFKYPGSEKYAIQNLNLTIRSSERLCIVGANGSGKTTFIKLLTRLYFPTEGEITLNGVNINEFDYRRYQDLFAPVFQDFQLLFMSLRQNVALSLQEDEARLGKVYADCNLDGLIDSLPYKDQTQVYKWECADGFEPSGGEGQRIAIARALYHDRKICLLDEPTAALDPNAEYEIYTQFNRMIENKCAILITHRLSAVQLADRVAVFDGGHVAEYGSHAELYAKGGIYTEMFDKQAQFYRDNPAIEDLSKELHN